jgi:hypothetical protein
MMRIGGVLLVLSLVAGCAGTPAATPTRMPTPPPTSKPTVEATPRPSASPTGTATARPSDGARELTATGEPLPPGRYTRAAFQPRVTFELDGSWQAVQAGSGFFDVQQLVDTPDVIAVQFGRVHEVPGDGRDVVPTDAAHAADLVAENEELDLVERSESRIGGLRGSQLTVANEGRSHVAVIEVFAGTLGIDPGRRLWLAFFDHPDGLIVVMVGGSTARWQEALDAAEPVLESIRFEGT